MNATWINNDMNQNIYDVLFGVLKVYDVQSIPWTYPSTITIRAISKPTELQVPNIWNAQRDFEPYEFIYAIVSAKSHLPHIYIIFTTHNACVEMYIYG